MAPTEHRTLFIAPTLPAETGNGLAIRMGLFAEALSRVSLTELLCIPMFGLPVDDGFLEHLGIPSRIIDPAGREDTQYRLLSQLVDPAERLRAFRSYGRGSLAARLSRPVLAEVARFAATRRFDLVHVGRAYMMEAAMAASGTAICTADLDEDDAWSWRSLGAMHRDPLVVGWHHAEAMAADRSLRQVAPRFDELFVSGPVDAGRLARRHAGMRPIVVNNPAPAAQAISRRDDGRTVLFVGSFGYAPNVDGLDWLIEQIWPRVHRFRPDLRLQVVGRDVPARFTALNGHGGVEVVGAVDDLGRFYETAMLAIAPLRAGGGTRVKLIEAAALGVPIVSTTLAARGLAFGNPRGMWIADTSASFAGAVIEAAGNPDDRLRRAALARRAAVARHDRERIVDQLACRFAARLAK